MRFELSLFLIFGAGAPAWAQDVPAETTGATGELLVVVVDRKQDPVAGASVTFTDGASWLTDGNGELLVTLPAGVVGVVASREDLGVWEMSRLRVDAGLRTMAVAQLAKVKAPPASSSPGGAPTLREAVRAMWPVGAGRVVVTGADRWKAAVARCGTLFPRRVALEDGGAVLDELPDACRIGVVGGADAVWTELDPTAPEATFRPGP